VQVFADEIIGETDYPAEYVVFSPDGKTVATAGYTEDGKHVVTLWDVPRPGDKKK
jgi:hypothetical protein